MTKKHLYKKWEVSVIELKTKTGKKYKVTRRIADLKVSETKFFKTKQNAKDQFEEWLN